MHLFFRPSQAAHKRVSKLSSTTFRIVKTGMSTKTIAVLNDSDLKDGQMKEVDFDQGKVLLARLGDKIHATSAFCTHYGAPLSKGVLTSDGRVVCPWHGACFSIRTGDIEDAPAPSALHCFKAEAIEGKIYVTANPTSTLKDNMSRPPTLTNASTHSSGKGIVIVGGGSATFHAVESLREHGFNGSITILTKEPHAPIDRTKLSKALITDASKLEWRTAADLKIKYGTTLRTGVTVTSISVEKQTVTLSAASSAPTAENPNPHQSPPETLSYDKALILAPGSIPRRLPVEGADLQNVFTFRGVADATKVDSAAQAGKRLVVIGSSFISMELVAALSKRKLESIDVVGMEEYPFEAVLGKEIGKGLKTYHETQGVKFHMSSSVSRIVASDTDTSVAKAVVVGKGENEVTLAADLVVMGVGVQPATSFLEGSGIPTDKIGAVKVDECLRVIGNDGSPLKNIYAVGDIAVYPQAQTGESVRVEHWNVAGNHGRAIGKTITGTPQPFVKVPVFWSAQGQQLRYCGIGTGFDEVFVKGDAAELKFIAYYMKQGKVIAVASMQNDPVVSKASELLRLGLMPTGEEVKAGKDLLSVDISTVEAVQA